MNVPDQPNFLLNGEVCLWYFLKILFLMGDGFSLYIIQEMDSQCRLSSLCSIEEMDLQCRVSLLYSVQRMMLLTLWHKTEGFRWYPSMFGQWVFIVSCIFPFVPTSFPINLGTVLTMFMLPCDHFVKLKAILTQKSNISVVIACIIFKIKLLCRSKRKDIPKF